MNALRVPLSAAANAAVRLALRPRGSTFADSVLLSIAQLRQKSISDPTIDYSRYPDGMRPFGPFATLIVSTFVKRNYEAINQTSALFEDEQSRELLRQLLTFRAVGPYHMRLSVRPHFLADVARASLLRVGESDICGFPSGLYALEVPAGRINAECTLGSVVQGVFGGQYFFRRDDVSIQVEKGDTVIDAGGCYGDTAMIMASAAGPNGRVYSFEPVPDQVAVFERNLARNPELATRIKIVRAAVGAASDNLVRFSRLGAGSRESKGGEIEVRTLTIDDLVLREGLSTVDYIKMDVEGAETRALRGAVNSVRRFRPKLGISVYHSLSDLIFLPQLVKEIEPTYQLYLDHHTVHVEETVLYAVAGSC